MLKSITPEF